MSVIKVAIFASGRGSNAVALIQKAEALKGKIEISFVLTDQPAARVIEKVQELGVPTVVLPRKTTKAQHEADILNVVFERGIDWIFLAGYMRLLSADFLKVFSAKVAGAPQVVNIHPSLLPAYPGVDSIARAYADKALESGVTIHLVDEGVDTGTVLLQEALRLAEYPTLGHFEKQMHKLEHQLYGRFLEEVAQGLRQTKKFQLG